MFNKAHAMQILICQGSANVKLGDEDSNASKHSATNAQWTEMATRGHFASIAWEGNNNTMDYVGACNQANQIIIWPHISMIMVVVMMEI